MPPVWLGRRHYLLSAFVMPKAPMEGENKASRLPLVLGNLAAWLATVSAKNADKGEETRFWESANGWASPLAYIHNPDQLARTP
jgi:hypothetical protein